MKIPSGRVHWRTNQARALGRALANGFDLGARVDAIILCREEDAGRADAIALSAWAEGVRPALMLADPGWLEKVKFPAGVPVYVVPPEEEAAAKALAKKIGPMLSQKKLDVLWAAGPEARNVSAIGFRGEGEPGP